ncbi:MAG: methionyl-tRNA formyltransferase [Flavobacteriales bacterium]|nr:methionyl-tRNA formyltransferase [Flavobacteriales bacterium]|tara:strand:+ start:295 stop:1275 length:981 start_codon:yes stop_codon:yes gene_type:complete
MADFPTSPLKRTLRIVFFGTPEFATVCLDSLVESQHEVIGVVTAPDRRSGRGQKIQQSAVKSAAVAHGLPCLQPANLKTPEFNEALAAWEADVYVVVAFRMLPRIVWEAPQFGTINLHASLLPQLRGAAPIQWAIMHGLNESGVSTFSLQHAIDTGDVLLQSKVTIEESDNAGTLYEKLLIHGKALLLKTLDSLLAGELMPQPQLSVKPRLEAPKLCRENTLINWHETTDNVLNKIRGLYPIPKSWTPSPIGDIKVLKAHSIDPTVALPRDAQPGTVEVIRDALVVRCSDGWIGIDELIPPGKGRMSGIAWSNGLQTPVTQIGDQA